MCGLFFIEGSGEPSCLLSDEPKSGAKTNLKAFRKKKGRLCYKPVERLLEVKTSERNGSFFFLKWVTLKKKWFIF
jgi:hypothetical protein